MKWLAVASILCVFLALLNKMDVSTYTMKLVTP